MSSTSFWVVRKWQTEPQVFGNKAAAIGYAISLLTPEAPIKKGGLLTYLHRALNTYHAVEYLDLTIVHHECELPRVATKKIPKFTDIV